MSAEIPTARKGLALRELEAEARYARERYQLYKARSYSSRDQSRAPPRARATLEVGAEVRRSREVGGPDEGQREAARLAGRPILGLRS
jgi:hypothetical protein